MICKNAEDVEHPQETFVLVKTSWRRLQDLLIKTSMFALALRLQKTFWSRPVYSSWLYVFKMSSRRFEDVFKKSSRRLAKMSSRSFQDVLQKRLQNVFKTSWKSSLKHFQDILQRYLQDVFKTYYQVKLFLLTRLWEAFNTFLRRSFPKTVIYSRGICLGNTTSEKFMVSV